MIKRTIPSAGLTFILFALTAQAGLRTIGEIGGPAADFLENFVYWEVANPVIGANGHIAFMGAADVSVNSTAENTTAIWMGRPGNFHTIIREGESPEGFPASVVLDFPFKNELVITDKGAVAAEVYLKGSAPGRAYIATVGDTTHGVIRVGMPAPGYGPGINVTGLNGFVYTDAGMAILGTANFQVAMWFWDKTGLELLAAQGMPLAPAYPECDVFSFGNGNFALAMNQKGSVALTIATTANSEEVECPNGAIYRWNAGSLTRVVAASDAVPGMPAGTEFKNNLGVGIGSVSINDNDDITFHAEVVNSGLGESMTSIWMARANGSLRPVYFFGESLPDSPNELTITPNASRSNAIKRTVFATSTTAGARVILAGKLKAPGSYSSFDDIVSSQLRLVTHEDAIPPGFPDTWYRDNLGEPVINNRSTIAYWADARDALDPFFSSTWGIWLSDKGGTEKLLVAEDRPIRIDGADQTLSLVREVTLSNFSGGETTNSGRPSQLSDNGQLVFMGAKSGSFPSNIFVTELCPTATMNQDLGANCMADIVIRNANTGQVKLWQMDGSTKKVSNIGALGNNWVVDAVGDLTGDGKADLVLRHKNTRELRLWEMNGNKHSESTIGPLNAGWKIRDLGDVGGDGKADLLLRNVNNGKVNIWQMKSNNKTASNLGTLILKWQVAGMGDFNGDGTADVLFRHKNSGDVKLWLLDGDSKTESIIGGMAPKWRILGVGDLRGDGKTDIVVRNKNTDLVKLWEMDGNVKTVSTIGTLNSNWDVVQISDFDADGNADLLLRNTTTGFLKIWKMDGNAVMSSGVGGLNQTWVVQ